MTKHLRALCLLLSCTMYAPALATHAQDEIGPSPAQLLPEGWIPLDGVAIVVNSDTITRRAIERHIERAMTESKITTRQEFDTLVREAQLSQVENLLMHQAGEDLGFPQERIDAHVSGILDERQEDAGGAFEMARKLREDETTANEIREELESETLVVEWRRKIAGYGGPGSRSSEDRYTRPGRIAQHYRRIQRTGKDIDPLISLGARPATFELQILLLPGERFGSIEKAREVTIGARAAILSGEEEWDDLIESLGVLENLGLVGPLRIEDIQRTLDPGDNSLVQFVMEGMLENYSEVLPYRVPNPATGERLIAGFAIYRLLGREQASLPNYQVPGVQKRLRRFLDYMGDEQRMRLALDDLERTAYIWYPGIEEQRAASEKRLAARREAIEEARRRNAEKLGQPVEASAEQDSEDRAQDAGEEPSRSSVQDS